MHCTKISAEFELWDHSPWVRTPKSGVGLPLEKISTGSSSFNIILSLMQSRQCLLTYIRYRCIERSVIDNYHVNKVTNTSPVTDHIFIRQHWLRYRMFTGEVNCQSIRPNDVRCDQRFPGNVGNGRAIDSWICRTPVGPVQRSTKHSTDIFIFGKLWWSFETRV